MLKNYIITSFRAIRKDRFYLLVNQLSLSLAFALCTIGFFNYMFNQTFNHSFDGHESIYKINASPKSLSFSRDIGITPLALKGAFLSQFPDVEIGQFHRAAVNLKIGDRIFNESVGYVDPEFLSIIKFQKDPLWLGNDQVIITNDVALRLFGRNNVEGEVMEVIFSEGTKKLVKVGRVITTPPQNTSFKFSILLAMDNYKQNLGLSSNDWDEWVSGTFIKADQSERANIKAALDSFLPLQNSHNPELQLSAYRLDKLAEWAHLERNLYRRSFGTVLHPASVIGTLSSALAILLLACFNFFNTTIATSGKRLKEISMRKVMGGRRMDIVIQFITESAIQVLSAFLISLVITYFLIGSYNAMFRFELVQWQPAYIQPYVLYALSVCVLTVLLSGAYPAFYVSRFESLDILKNKVRFKGNSWLTKVLLTFQFSVCVYNIFALGVFVENAHYQETLDRGYDVKAFINIPVRTDKLDQIRHEVTQAAGFELVLSTKDLVGFSSKEVSFDYDGISYSTDKLDVGANYLSGLGVEFVSGVDFVSDRASNLSNIVINESFNNLMGKDMMNQQVTINGKKYTVAGITADFNLKSIMLTNKIKPTIFFFAPDSLHRYAVVKGRSQNLVADNKQIEQIWYQLFPEDLYEGFYQEKVFENLNHTNQIMVRINSFIAIVSILISILGLYALISLTAQRRIKEIGIRKALGASFRHVLKMLVNEISWLLIISVILGLAAGHYVINKLLDIIYAYHVEIDSLNSLFAFVVIILAAVLSIGYKVVTTAKMNPVTQLRNE